MKFNSDIALFFRRLGLVLLGVLAFPWVSVKGQRSAFYSQLYRQWSPSSSTPLWLQQSEKQQSTLWF
ncbi:DUF2517 family protein [Alginatibacterium sediminis]|uniref:DUF2517 family protein n=2 Tax=Alginatibacterium sediminis TaxID=2164068 RepID=A0A420E6J6_9ALTE|nr:DUF2517 family protein [Alginatibacterium sediminis]